MDQVTYKAKCDALFDKAKAKGVILHFIPEKLTFNRTNCLWLGGNIAVIEIDENLSVDISAIGDVIAILYDENQEELASSKDKSNQGAFESNMSFYIKDDKELHQLLEDGRLVLRNNNWIEYGTVISFMIVSTSSSGITETFSLTDAAKLRGASPTIQT